MLAPWVIGCSDDTRAAPLGSDAGSDVGTTVTDTGPVFTVSPDAGRFEQPLVQDLQVTEVSLFQSVKVPLLNGDGVVPTDARSAPLVAGRATAVRVYVAPQPGWVPQSVIAQLIVRNGGQSSPPLNLTRYVNGPSNEAYPTSMFTFDLPADRITTDTEIAVQLVTPTGRPTAEGTANPARMPADGSTVRLNARPNPGVLRVTLVPVTYNTDQSGRMPDTSELQLAQYRELLMAMYPISGVEFTVHDPIATTRPLLASRSFDFSSLLTELRNLRVRDGADDDMYYYALVAPAESFREYCDRGCVLGQGFVVSADESGRRVAAGLGFSGQSSAGTMAHELGHLHGRLHSPCGATGTDNQYPHDNGVLGVWGYDVRRRFFYPPGMFDFMSYCNPEWISDYTYSALYDRIAEVNGITSQVLRRPRGERQAATLPFRVMRWDAGGVRWDASPLQLESLASLSGPRRVVEWRDVSHAVIGRAEAVIETLGDGEELQAVLPPAPPGAVSVTVVASGSDRAHTLNL